MPLLMLKNALGGHRLHNVSDMDVQSTSHKFYKQGVPRLLNFWKAMPDLGYSPINLLASISQ